MFSWAIPRGFDPPYHGARLGIETFPHGLSYALYEGLATHGQSHVGIWDVGQYQVSAALSSWSNKTLVLNFEAL